MSEQRVPYQAGEPAAETSMAEVAAEAWFRAAKFGWLANDWTQNFGRRQREEWAAVAAAVEAEVLRRAVAYLEAQRQATGDDPLLQEEYAFAAERVREYAEQQREG